MFGRERVESRVLKLEKEVKKLKNTVNTLQKLHEERSDKKDEPSLTDPIQYVDPLGVTGYYRRVGSMIEFNAAYPPEGINIKTETLSKAYGNTKTAEVIGWETKTEYVGQLQSEKVKAYYLNDYVETDTHGFIYAHYDGYKITFPYNDTYHITFTGKFNKGDVLELEGLVDGRLKGRLIVTNEE